MYTYTAYRYAYGLYKTFPQKTESKKCCDPAIKKLKLKVRQSKTHPKKKNKKTLIVVHF